MESVERLRMIWALPDAIYRRWRDSFGTYCLSWSVHHPIFVPRGRLTTFFCFIPDVIFWLWSLIGSFIFIFFPLFFPCFLQRLIGQSEANEIDSFRCPPLPPPAFFFLYWQRHLLSTVDINSINWPADWVRPFLFTCISAAIDWFYVWPLGGADLAWRTRKKQKKEANRICATTVLMDVNLDMIVLYQLMLIFSNGRSFNSLPFGNYLI